MKKFYSENIIIGDRSADICLVGLFMAVCMSIVGIVISYYAIKTLCISILCRSKNIIEYFTPCFILFFLIIVMSNKIIIDLDNGKVYRRIDPMNIIVLSYSFSEFKAVYRVFDPGDAESNPSICIFLSRGLDRSSYHFSTFTIHSSNKYSLQNRIQESLSLAQSISVALSVPCVDKGFIKNQNNLDIISKKV